MFSMHSIFSLMNIWGNIEGNWGGIEGIFSLMNIWSIIKKPLGLYKRNDKTLESKGHEESIKF
jgi:hypothetical protein